MKWTAALHPEFVGEVGSLSSLARQTLLGVILEQQSFGPLAADVLWCNADPFSYSEKYFRLGDLIVAFDSRALQDGFVYLYAGEGGDGDARRIARERLTEVYDGKARPLAFDDYFEGLPREDRKPAIDRVGLKSSRAIQRQLLLDAVRDARDEMGKFLNYSPAQMASFESRLDHYLSVVNAHCAQVNISARLLFNSAGRDCFEAASFRELADIK